jgi:hypothetical protein
LEQNHDDINPEVKWLMGANRVERLDQAVGIMSVWDMTPDELETQYGGNDDYVKLGKVFKPKSAVKRKLDVQAAMTILLTETGQPEEENEETDDDSDNSVVSVKPMITPTRKPLGSANKPVQRKAKKSKK